MLIVAVFLQLITPIVGFMLVERPDRHWIRRSLSYGFGGLGFGLFLIWFAWFVSTQRPDGFSIDALLVWSIANIIVGGLLTPRPNKRTRIKTRR